MIRESRCRPLISISFVLFKCDLMWKGTCRYICRNLYIGNSHPIPSPLQDCGTVWLINLHKYPNKWTSNLHDLLVSLSTNLIAAHFNTNQTTVWLASLTVRHLLKLVALDLIIIERWLYLSQNWIKFINFIFSIFWWCPLTFPLTKCKWMFLSISYRFFTVARR